MKIIIGCFSYDFNPLYCTATFFGHQLHTYVPLIDLVQLEAFMDSCNITDKVWIIKKVPSLGDHNLILLSIFMEKVSHLSKYTEWTTVKYLVLKVLEIGI